MTSRLVLIPLAALVGALAGQSATPPNEFVKLAYAITICDSATGWPVTHYRVVEPQDSLTMAELAVHEGVHRRQLAPDSSGTCAEKFARAVATPRSLLALEAPAYCAQILFAARISPIPMINITRMIQLLSGYLDLPPREIVEAFRRAGCDLYPGASPPIPAILRGSLAGPPPPSDGANGEPQGEAP